MARPAMHHRTPEFRELLLETRSNLQKIFDTCHEVVILASSGTGAMEASVANLLSPGDQAVAVVAGKFGERWLEICAAMGIECIPLTKQYGQAADAQEVAELLRWNRKARALLIQGCETSTATCHDLQSIAARAREVNPEILIVVDAITALGCQPLATDEWGLDVVISGSQKAFGIPPGLAFLSLSPRAVQVMEEGPGASRYYFNLAKELKSQVKGNTAYTPAVSLIAALLESTRRILAQGVPQVIRETEWMARATRDGLQSLGFRLLSEAPANAVTAAFPPSGVDAEELRKRLQDRFGVKVAGGQGELKGKIIRIAHLGYFDILDACSVLCAIELCLLELGRRIEAGSSIRAAMQRSLPEMVTAD